MNIRWTPLFQRDFKRLPKDVQSRAEKAIRLLKQNPRYPSLRSKKLEKVENIWEATVTMSYRITYEISGQTLILRRIGTHDILKVESR
jgi:addiction module RelE/StbE family toxin